MEDIKYSTIKTFGPSIFKAEMPKDLVTKLNQYVDTILKNKEKSSELNHGLQLAGDVTQEFKLEMEFIKKSGWGEFLMKSTDRWIHIELNKRISKFRV